MSTRLERLSALAGIAAVALWVVGFVLAQAITSPPSDSATDAQILAWVQDKSGYITGGGWLFMIGCGCYVWFAGTLRSRLAAAEGGVATFSTIAFAGGVVAAVFAMGLPGGDFAAAINQSDISAATAGALHHVGDVFFAVTEISAAVMLTAVGVVVLRTRVLPRAWAVVSLVLAVVLLIGPIGWLAVLVGLPAWTVVTVGLLLRSTRTAEARTLSPAAA
jgi:hypothetical protein